MKDIGIDGDFDVIIDQRNDLSLKEKREEFEQMVQIYIKDYFYDEIGSLDQKNAKKRLTLHANRIVNDNDRLNEVEGVSVENGLQPSSVEVTIFYRTDETFIFEFN